MKLFNKIKSIINSEAKKTLFVNYLSLASLQIINYILPLIVIPYLFMTLNAEKFGLVYFAQAVVVYFSMIIGYGFNLSAVKEVSVNRDNKEKINEIYSTITYIKSFMFIVLFFIFYLIIYSFDKFSNEQLLYLFTYGMIIESILFPVWLFQGLEKMKFITLIYFTSKVVATLLIFIIIKEENDYYKVPIIYLISTFISGLIAIYVIRFKLQIKLIPININQVVYQLKEGWHLFIANLSGNLYRNSNILILGFLTNNTFVGFYALAEKVVKAIQSIMIPVSDTLYPFIAKRVSIQSNSKNLEDIFKISKYYFLILVALVILLIILAPFIVKLLSGTYNENIILNMRVLSLVVLFGSLNYLIGVVGLISFGEKKYLMKSMLTAGILNIVLCTSLSYFFNDLGASISLTIAETILFILLWIKINTLKKGEKNND